MAKFLIKRILVAVFICWLVATLTFFLMNLVPGGPFMAQKAFTPEAEQLLMEKYGLDQPLLHQYKVYMGRLLHGDLGPSMKQRGRTVASIIASTFPASASVGFLAIMLSLAVALPMGCLAASKKGSLPDRLILLFSSWGTCLPGFVICTFFMYLLSYRLNFLPSYGLITWKHYIMPVAALAVYPASYMTQLVRSSMEVVLNQEYMHMIRANGVPKASAVFRHGLKNGALPVVTCLGPMVTYTVTGSFVAEKIFGIPGLGSEFVGAITGRDYPLIMGITIFLAAFLIAANTAADIAYTVLDPRIKLK